MPIFQSIGLILQHTALQGTLTQLQFFFENWLSLTQAVVTFFFKWVLVSSTINWLCLWKNGGGAGRFSQSLICFNKWNSLKYNSKQVSGKAKTQVVRETQLGCVFVSCSKCWQACESSNKSLNSKFFSFWFSDSFSTCALYKSQWAFQISDFISVLTIFFSQWSLNYCVDSDLISIPVPNWSV